MNIKSLRMKNVINVFAMMAVISLISLTNVQAQMTWTVNNTQNSGIGSLRAAVDSANARAGADTIKFAVGLKDSTITLLSTITLQTGNGNGTVIDGDIDGDNKPSIIIAGTRGDYSGIQINGNNNTIKNVNMVRHGVFLQTSSAVYINTNSNFNRITGNYFGISLTGTDTINTGNNISISISSSAASNFIGDTLPECRNVISGTSWSGIQIRGTNNYILNNIIGLNAAGTTSMGSPNDAIYVRSGSSNNYIGNGTPAGRNIISGNRYGIYIQGISNANTRLLGNYIGTDITGILARGNYQGGIMLDNTSYNYIGNGTSGGRNVISGNGAGIISSNSSNHSVINGNYIGVRPDGVTALGNSTGIYTSGNANNDSVTNNVIAYSGASNPGVRIDGAGTVDHKVFKNSIYNNGGPGISITNGAQQGVIPPVIQSVSADSTVSGTASPNALVQIYADSSDEGRYYLDTVRADGAGNWSKKVTIPAGMRLTALQDSNGNTSAFSAPKDVPPAAPAGMFATAGNRSADLIWFRSPSGNAVKYRIFRRQEASYTQVDSTVSANDTSKTLINLTNDSLYYFVVAGVSAANVQGFYSNERAVVPVVEAGNAAVFNDVNDVIKVGNHPILNPLNAMTVEAWIKLDPTGYGTPREVLSKGNDFNPGTYRLRVEPDNTIEFRIRNGVDNISVAGGILDENVWYHVAGTWDGTMMTIYVNGQPSGTTPLAGPIPVNMDTFQMGRHQSTSNWWYTFSGDIDEVRVWDFALSGSEINAKMIKPARGDETGLLYLAHLDEPDGTAIVHDASIYGNNGTGTVTFNGSGAMAPVQPTGIIVVNHEPDSVVVNWNANTESDLRHYIIYRSLTNNFIPSQTDTVGRTNKPGVSFSDITAVPGNQYYYRVAPVDSALQMGLYSAQASLYYGNPLTVYNTFDGGFGSLRAAVDSANARAGADTIKFAPGLKDSTITLLSAITLQTGNGDSTVIDGDIDGDNLPSITLNGQGLGFSGIHIYGAGNHIKYLNIVRCGNSGFHSAIGLEGGGAYSNRITGNYLGTNLSGTSISGTGNINGITILYGSDNNTIGDTVSAGRNIISGNQFGVFIYSGVNNRFYGNYFGTDISGNIALPNTDNGIWLDEANGTAIGNGTAGGRNIISGNSNGNLRISLSNSVTVLGNYIGTNAAGTAGLSGPFGIYVDCSINTLIGDGTPGGRNIISGNSGAGVNIGSSAVGELSVNTRVLGNYIGTNSSGTTAISNAYGIIIGDQAIQNYIGDGTVSGRNIVSGNGNAGIRVYSSVLTDCGRNVIAGNYIGVNVSGDPLSNNGSGIWSNVSGDSVLSNVIACNNSQGISIDGANADSNIFYKNSIYNNAGNGIQFYNGAQQNVDAPVILYISADTTLAGTASPNALVQIYADSAAQGRFFLDTVRANGSGNWSKKVTIPAGMQLTALQDSNGNTSMFSNPYILSGDIDLAGRTQIDFGNVGAGLAKHDTLTVYNRAPGVLSFTSLSVKHGSTAFMIIDTIPDSNWPDLMPGDSVKIVVRFNPASFAGYADTLLISTNDPVDSIVYVRLEGSGIAGSLSVNPPDYNFGSLPCGDSLQTVVKIHPAGGMVSIMSMNSFAHPDFKIDSLSLSVPRTLALTDTLKIYAKFRPRDFGPSVDSLIIQNNSTNPSIAVRFNGNSFAGNLAASPSAYDFADVGVGDSAQTIIKVYTSGGAVDITNANMLSGVQFEIDSTSLTIPRTLYVNDTLKIYAKFLPMSFGAQSDTVILQNNSTVPSLKIPLTGNGTVGTLVANPANFNFSGVPVGDSAQTMIRVYTSGGAVSITDTDMFSGIYFKIDSTSLIIPLTLYSNDTLKIYAKFRPMSFDAQSDTIILANNSPVPSFKIPLTGNVTVGTLVANPANFDFADVPVGDSAQTMIKVYTDGGAVSISDTNWFSGLYFKMDSTSLTIPRTLYTNDTLVIYAKFRPTAFGAQSDTVILINNSPEPSFTIPLTGNGISGVLTSSGDYDFGNVPVTTGDSATLKLYAIGGSVSVDSIVLATGVPYALSGLPLLPHVIDIGDSITFKAHFNPTTFGSFADVIRVVNNSSMPLVTVDLTGTGASGGLMTSFTDYDFGNVPVSSSDTVRLKIYTSGGSVRIDTLDFENPSGFAIDDLPALPRTLDPNDTLSLLIRFTPPAFGSFSDVLRIVNNSGISPVNVNLTGTGASGGLMTSFTSYDFGAVPVSSSDTVRLKIFTTGGSVRIDTLDFENPSGFAIDDLPVLPRTLNPNDTLSLLIRFTPPSFGSFNDVLRIVNNSPASLVTVDLTGSGQAGNLSLSTNDLNYPLIQTGDSSVAQFKMYPTLGVVRVDSIRLVSPHYVMTPVTLPQILSADNHDTVAVTVTYRPQSAGHHTDTVYVYSNAVQYSLWTLKLEGDAYSNSAPNSFALKSVGTNNLTNSRTPLLSWENRGDPDGDVIQYRVDVSLQSDFATPADTAATYDSAYTVRTTLDSSAIYYWRVTARDPKGAETVSGTGQFRIDAVAAELTLGTFFGSVLKQYISVGVITNKPMRTMNGGVGLRSADNTLLDTVSRPFDLISAENRYYQMPYKLGSSGKLFIMVSGTDSAQNAVTIVRDYTIGAIAKEQALAMVSEDGGWQIAAAKRTFGDDGYLMVSRLSGESKTVKDKSVMTIAKISGQWTDIGEGLNIQGSAPLREGQGIVVTMKYDDDAVSELQSRYTDYDERKIGLYTESNGEWIYIGGEGKGGQIQAKVKQYGMYKLMYNPDHEFLPVKVELAQNYPNPFNPVTTIRFGIPQDGKVKLTIYNVLGQKVKELVNDSRGAGYYNVIWNGRSDRGSVVSSGVYLYRLETRQGTVVKKMIYIK